MSFLMAARRMIKMRMRVNKREREGAREKREISWRSLFSEEDAFLSFALKSFPTRSLCVCVFIPLNG